MRDFEVKCISDLCDVTSSKRIFKADYLPEGVPFYRAKEISEKHNGKELSDRLFISMEKFETFRKKFGVPQEGDLLLTSIGALLGEPYVVSNDGDFYFKDGNLTWFRNFRGLKSKYLYYWLIAPQGKAQLATAVIGSAQPAFTIAALKTMSIGVPSVPYQSKVVAILSAYDDLIENNTRRIAILEEMTQTIYREWFVNFRFPGHENVKLVDSPLGQIPEGWEVLPLGSVVEITMGTSPKGDTYNENRIGTPLVNGPVEFDTRFTKRVKWTTAPNKMCKAGDLIVCVRGSTTGKNVKSDGEYCLGRGVCCIRSKHQAYADLLFQNELPKLLAQTGGSTFPSWTAPQLKGHPVLVPPRPLMDAFETIASSTVEGVSVYSHKNRNLRTTRDLLLPKLISGKLDVEDLDIDSGMTAEALEEAMA